MEIREVVLEGFKKFKSRRFHFEPGFNCIFGLNESGKSTLLHAIRAAFFGARPEDVASWASDDLCLAQVSYTVDDDRIFTLQRDFHSGHVSLTTDAGTEINAPQQVRNLLGSHLGFVDNTYFEDIAFVQQAQIARIRFASRSSDISSFLPGLDRLMQAQKSVRKQLDGLDNAHPNIKHTRLLQEKEAMLTEKEARHHEHMQLVDQYRQLQAEYEEKRDYEQDMQARIKRYEAALNAMRLHRENKAKAADIQEDLDHINAVYNSLEQVATNRRDYAAELKELETNNFSDDFDVRADFLVEQTFRLEEETNVHAKIGSGSSRLIDLILWFAAMVFFAFGLIIKQNLLFIVGLLLIAVWGFLFIRRSASLGAEQARSSFEKDRHIVLDQVRELSPIFNDIDDDDPNFTMIRNQLESLQKSFRRYQKVRNLDNEARIRWEQTVIQLPSEWDLPHQPAELLNHLSQLRQKLEEEIAELSLEPDDLELGEDAYQEDQLQPAIDELRDELPAVQDARIRLEAELRTLAETMKGWEDLEGDIDMLRDEISRIKHRVAILKKVEDGLQETIHKFAAFPNLNEKISRYFNHMTAGAYQTAGLHNRDGGWQFVVEVPGVSDSLAPDDALSLGTIEQFYLAFRLAFIERYPSPLFLDDVLINFDRIRRKKTLDLLNTLSKNRQVILTTHDTTIPKMLEKVAHRIELN